MQHPLEVLGFAGSLRRGSYNRGLIRAAAEMTPPDVRVTVVDIAAIEHYNDDVEALGEPPAVAAFKEAIGRADALLVATPEYNHSVPGVLKNAIDWASRPARNSVLRDKPIAITGATPSPGETARAQAHLRDIFAFTGACVMPIPELMIGQAQTKFDDAGNLVDEPTRNELRELLEALADWTARIARPAAA
jgi:chromate reductase